MAVDLFLALKRAPSLDVAVRAETFARPEFALAADIGVIEPLQHLCRALGIPADRLTGDAIWTAFNSGHDVEVGLAAVQDVCRIRLAHRRLNVTDVIPPLSAPKDLLTLTGVADEAIAA